MRAVTQSRICIALIAIIAGSTVAYCAGYEHRLEAHQTSEYRYMVAEDDDNDSGGSSSNTGAVVGGVAVVVGTAIAVLSGE